MRSHASGIERLLVCSLPLALVLGLLGAALGGLVDARGQVAHADNPSITIVSPTTANGPVQTNVQINGAGWNPGASIQVFYSAPANNQPCGDPNNSQTLAQTNAIPGVGTQTAGGDGSWKVGFQWPSNTGTGSFYICAFDKTTPTQVTPSAQPFQVLSTTLPGITLSNGFPNAGDQITVTGTGFLPGNQPIDLILAQQGQQTGANLGTATADGNGNFQQQVTLPLSPSGQLSIVALSRTPVQGALPPLIASQQVTIGAAPSTPTPTPAPSVTPSPTATATTVATTTPNTTTTSSSKSNLLLVLLVVALVLVILAIFGVLIWYVVGTRPPPNVGAPPGSPPPGRTRAPVAPRRTTQSSGWESLPDWQQDDEWEGDQGPWEEDEQGGWNDLPTQWSDESSPWPQSGPSGPGGRGSAGAQRPAPRGPNRDDWQGRARPGQDGW
ncbi:MAG TPA: hypothetical protein VKT82_07055 [Ktedonobacterales bacterium]|nr:hypothetical protein [Ktedonobacterales bacterium]